MAVVKLYDSEDIDRWMTTKRKQMLGRQPEKVWVDPNLEMTEEEVIETMETGREDKGSREEEQEETRELGRERISFLY